MAVGREFFVGWHDPRATMAVQIVEFPCAATPPAFLSTPIRMLEEVNGWFENGSYVGIFLGMALTGLGLPVPEEAFVLFAGMAAAHGALKSPWLALLVCWLGATAGDLITYTVGRRFGHGVLREHPMVAKHLTPERERHIEELIQRHGFKVFLVSRFLVGVRSPVYLTAGILRVPLWRFLAYDAISATVVVGTFFGLAYFFADRIQLWWNWIRQAELALTVIVVLAVVIGGFVLYRKYKHMLHGEPEALLDQAFGCDKCTDDEPYDPTATEATSEPSSVGKRSTPQEHDSPQPPTLVS